jgi:hypothetical protein
MSQKIVYRYFRGIEADYYSFYRIPKLLFTHEFFKDLSCEAKVLYGLMLDRMSLSVKNGWFDEEKRAYIIFTVEEVTELLGCSTGKAVKCISELDTDKGIGLIEKKRLGLGKANIIYVRQIQIKEVVDEEEGYDSYSDDCEDYIEPEKLKKGSENPVNTQNSKICNSRIPKKEIQECQKIELQNSKKCDSGTSKNRVPELQKSKCNNTEYNNTDYSYTESYLSIREDHENQVQADRQIGKMDEIQATREVIQDNIEYEALCYSYRKESVDEIVDIIVETVCSGKPFINVNSEAIPAQQVRNRLMKVGYSHIQYVFECLEKNTTQVRNIRQYLLTALYNAPSTIHHYYSAEVRHDMYGGGNLFYDTD